MCWIVVPGRRAANAGAGAFQEVDQLRMVEAVTKERFRITRPERTPWIMGRAFALAVSLAFSARALYVGVEPLWPTGQALPWCPVKLSPHVTPATPEGVGWPGSCEGQSTNGLPPPSTGSAPSDVM